MIKINNSIGLSWIILINYWHIYNAYLGKDQKYYCWDLANVHQINWLLIHLSSFVH